MAFKKKSSMVQYFLLLLDTLTFDQRMLFFSIFFNGFSSAWYSTFKSLIHDMYICGISYYAPMNLAFISWWIWCSGRAFYFRVLGGWCQGHEFDSPCDKQSFLSFILKNNDYRPLLIYKNNCWKIGLCFKTMAI